MTPTAHPYQNRALPKETPLAPSAEMPYRASRFATILATVVGNLYLVFGSTFFSILTLLVGWVPPRP